MSPVSVKTNRENPLAGANTPFSGRLNGVAFACFASAFASKASNPSCWVLCTVTQRVRKWLPYVCSARTSGEVMS